jgi:quercetin dioxygenase-like cupin family protein
MKYHVIVATLFSMLLAGGASMATDKPAVGVVDKGPDHHLFFRSADIEWQDGPASLPPGARFAVLEGDPGQPGVFTMRLKFPDDYHIPPHWHPNVERLTVVSGTFHLGAGEALDRTAAQPLPAGSYTSMPPGMRHFAFADGETVVQLTSIGPWEINYVDPEDDPRRND